MKNKWHTVRYQLVGTYLLSGIIAFIQLFILIVIGLLFFAKDYNSLINWTNNHLYWTPLIFLGGIIVFILLMTVTFLILTKNKVVYLESITRALAQIAKGDLSTRVSVRGKDEIASLATTVNQMASQLEQLQEEQLHWEKAKDELVSNVAHDLKTPLTSILGFLEIIKEERYKSQEELVHYIDITYEKGKKMHTLIEELLDYSRLQNRNFCLHKEKLHIGQLLEQVVVGFIPRFEKSGMNYDLQLPQEPIEIVGDGGLIARVIENLINNAILYGNSGGRLDINVRKEDSSVAIEVINYGTPISKEDLPYIFERLYRGDKSRSQKQKGTGLGLAIVKSVVDLHNGEVKVKSDEKETIFTVVLPSKE